MIIAYHSLLSRSIEISGERAPGLGAMLRQRCFLFQPVKLPTPGPGQMPGLEDNAAFPLKQAPAFEIAGPVSYTHLDVYKRQHIYCFDGCLKIITDCFSLFPGDWHFHQKMLTLAVCINAIHCTV